jgi:hypothetical protein
MKHKVHEGDFGGNPSKFITKTKMILNVKLKNEKLNIQISAYRR